jgi:hypothetical protein
MELAGFNVVNRQTNRLLAAVCTDLTKGSDIDLADPTKVEAFIVSKNIHRRHLTQDQKRELIEKLLKAKPERSNLATAKLAHADDKTVAAVRRDLEANSEIPNKTDRVEATGRKARGRKPAKKSAANGAEAAEPRPVWSYFMPGVTNEEERLKKAAELLDIDVEDIQRAGRIVEANPELGERIRRGELTLDDAEGEIAIDTADERDEAGISLQHLPFLAALVEFETWFGGLDWFERSQVLDITGRPGQTSPAAQGTKPDRPEEGQAAAD